MTALSIITRYTTTNSAFPVALGIVIWFSLFTLVYRVTQCCKKRKHIEHCDGVITECSCSETSRGSEEEVLREVLSQHEVDSFAVSSTSQSVQSVLYVEEEGDAVLYVEEEGDAGAGETISAEGGVSVSVSVSGIPSTTTGSSRTAFDYEPRSTETIHAPPGALGLIIVNSSLNGSNLGPVVFSLERGSPLDGVVHPKDRILQVDSIDVSAVDCAIVTTILAERKEQEVRVLIIQPFDDGFGV